MAADTVEVKVNFENKTKSVLEDISFLVAV